jgi:hypothetical protein
MLPLIASLGECGFGSASATSLAETLAGLDLATGPSSGEDGEGSGGEAGSPERRPRGGFEHESHEGAETAPLRRFVP